ncbi:hypothetical protein [Nostoc sp.]|uniref:hypothetical protein n=1 Tax=Nostoc sp. TaxID=1180 RepID=UPI002FFCF6FB
MYVAIFVAYRRYRLSENLKNKAIACCSRVSDRLAENLKNKAIACCSRMSAIALQKTSKTERYLQQATKIALRTFPRAIAEITNAVAEVANVVAEVANVVAEIANAIACWGRVSAIALRIFPKAIALQKTSTTQLSHFAHSQERSPCRQPQKQCYRLLWKSECDRLAENLKISDVYDGLRLRTSHTPKSDRITENLKNNG